VAYKLKIGESPADAAHALLGDDRLVSELEFIHGIAYIKGAEKPGPPAKWAAAPQPLPDLRTRP
jgi:hypothetical protein